MSALTNHYHQMIDTQSNRGGDNDSFNFTDAEMKTDLTPMFNDSVAWQCVNRLCMKVYSEPKKTCESCESPVKGFPF